MKRTLIFLLSLGLFGWFVYTRRADLVKLPFYFRRVDSNHVVMLTLLEGLFLLMCAESNRLVYRSLGVRNSLLDQLQLLLAAGTIERLFPSAGAAGMSSYVMLAKNRGIPVAESLKMTATTFVMGYAQVVPLLAIPLFALHNSPFPTRTSAWLVGVSAFFIVLVAVITLWIGQRNFVRVVQKWRWLRRLPRVAGGVVSAHEHVRSSWQHRRELVAPLLYLWALYPIRALMLYTCFAAFHVTLSWWYIWMGYSVTILISFLTFLPTTLGVFELSMVGTFVMFGVSTEVATAVTFLYRAFTYWLPVPLGLFSWWNLRRKVVA
jgi:uncharacterized protein (TIRG00374 family)